VTGGLEGFTTTSRLIIYICVFCNNIFYRDLQVKGGLEGFPMMLVGNKCDEEAGGQTKYIRRQVGKKKKKR